MEQSQWVNQLSSHLKLVYGSLANEAGGMRAECLTEEISRAVKQIPEYSRREYLESLRNEFPTQDEGLPTPAPVPAPPPDVKKILEETPTDKILQEFLRRTPQLKKEEKVTVARQLADGSGVGAGESKTTIQCLEAVLNQQLELHKLVWKIWQEMAPAQTRVRDSVDLRQEVAVCLSRNGGDARALLAAIEKDRRLVVAMLTAISSGARQYELKHQEQFSPEKIKAVVDQDRMWKGSGKDYWGKYLELSREVEAPGCIELKIKNSITKKTEELLTSYA